MSENTSIWGAPVSYEEAEAKVAERKAEEDARKGGGDKVDKVTIKDGENIFRVLPIVGTPIEDGTHVHGDYVHSVSYMWLKMEAKGQDKPVFRPVYAADRYGYNSNPLVKFRNALISAIKAEQKTKIGAKADVLKDLVENIYASDFGGNKLSLQQSHGGIMYVLQDGGIKLLERSSAQIHSLDEKRMATWNRRRSKARTADKLDPVVDPNDGYNVILTKGTGKKVEYTWEIDTDDDPVVLGEEVGAKLMAMPAIHQLNKYGRYQYEVTLEFLKQYSQQPEIAPYGVLESDEFQAYLKEFEAEIPTDDDGHFDIDDIGKKKDKGGKAEKEQKPEDEYADIVADYEDADKEDIELIAELKADLKEWADGQDIDISSLPRRYKIDALIELIDKTLNGDVEEDVVEEEPEKVEEVVKEDVEEPVEEKPTRRKRDRKRR